MSRHAKRWRAPRRSAAAEALEARRLLAVFTGTDNSDTIRITRVGSFTHVNINGDDQSTTDANVTVNALGDNDFILMDDVIPSIIINCGNGDDRVTYGGPTHDIFGDLPQTLIEGDAGTDTVNFDDSGGPVDTPREYDFTDLAAMNQVLFNFENLELRIRKHTLTGDGGLVQFSDGFPVSQKVSMIDSASPVGVDYNFGTATNPIDLDHYNLRVDFPDTNWNTTIYDQDSDSSGNPFSMFTSDGGAVQHLQKGGFELTSGLKRFGRIRLHCGTTNDNVGVGGIGSQGSFEIFGGDGDDSVFESNANGHINDLDAIIPFDSAAGSYGSLLFSGGEGSDSIDLNDSADQTGDGDQNYALEADAQLAFFQLTKGGGLSNQINFSFGSDVEHVNVVTDADPNLISFRSSPGQQITLNGGLGNDTFSLNSDVELQDCRGSVSLIGGSGTESFIYADDNPAEQALRNYSFGAGSFSYSTAQGAGGSILYDASLETFTIDENDASATTQINGKLSSTRLNIGLRDGDDTLTFGGGDLDSSGLLSGNITIAGGAGNDSITFDDHLDDDSDGTTSNYTMDNFSLAKGVAAITYSAFESQVLLAANGIVLGQINTIPVVNLNAVSSFLSGTTIRGGLARGCTVNVANGMLVNVAGAVTLQNCGVVNINDQNATGTTSSYEVNNSQVRKTSTGQTINYSGVAQMTLNTPNLNDSISIKSTPAGMSLVVNSNGGGDNIGLASGNVDADLLGPVTVNAGAGTDFLGFNNSLDTSPETQTLNAASFVDSGITYGFTGVEGTFTLALGDGGTSLTINGTPTNTNVTGGSGDDNFIVGGGDIDANFPATVGKGLFIQAMGGTNLLRLDDLNDANVDLYIFQQAQGLDQFRKRDGANEYFITWTGINELTLDASNAPASGASISTILVNSLGTPARLNGNGGPDSIQVADAFSPVTVNTGLGDLDSLSVNSDLDAVPVTVVVDQNDDIENLSIFNAGILRIADGATLLKTRLGANSSLDINGTLDLAGGAFLSRQGGPSLAALQALVARGYNGGAWNGTAAAAAAAVNSSLAAATPPGDAIGYGLGSQIGITSIGPFGIAPGDALLRYTLDGDANLDATISTLDFNALAANFGGSSKLWPQAEFNFDGTVDTLDFNALAASFGKSLPRPAATPSAASTGVFSEQPLTRDQPIVLPTDAPAGDII